MLIEPAERQHGPPQGSVILTGVFTPGCEAGSVRCSVCQTAVRVWRQHQGEPGGSRDGDNGTKNRVLRSLQQQNISATTITSQNVLAINITANRNSAIQTTANRIALACYKHHRIECLLHVQTSLLQTSQSRMSATNITE